MTRSATPDLHAYVLARLDRHLAALDRLREALALPRTTTAGARQRAAAASAAEARRYAVDIAAALADPDQVERSGPGDRRLAPKPITWGGPVDTRTALAREAEALARRFPEVDGALVERYVRETFAGLRDDVEVQSHLLAITRTQVTERLHGEVAAAHIRH